MGATGGAGAGLGLLLFRSAVCTAVMSLLYFCIDFSSLSV